MDRFAPGQVLADRYRIVGLVGRGGMGEVYRADDLKLEQPVALKFLAGALAGDRDRLERLYSEVRIARQVSHPAVCRVWDIGEADGQPFLSMEFVDGENLASLLRRIGRFPQDKAKDVARQVAEGLAAAHAKGLLHRDLKPANVMLDSQGHARLTDFGLAGFAESLAGDVRSGTPSYMSPEQLLGREVSVRSDVYALGLLVYELVTGRRAFEGKGFAELARRHRDERPLEPSALVPGLEPAVERTILACLEKEPRRRPPSALAVAAMLAGRDPLEAAIAAGRDAVAGARRRRRRDRGAAAARRARLPRARWWPGSSSSRSPRRLATRCRGSRSRRARPRSRTGRASSLGRLAEREARRPRHGADARPGLPDLGPRARACRRPAGRRSPPASPRSSSSGIVRARGRSRRRNPIGRVTRRDPPHRRGRHGAERATTCAAA